MRIVWELREGPTTTVTLTFWTMPDSIFDRIRETGRSGWWRRRWAKSLRRMQELIESGAKVPRIEVAGLPRRPAGVA